MSFVKKSPNINDISEINVYLEDLEQRIFEAFESGEFEVINLTPLSAALDKPREGDQIYADGTFYDPGSGKGRYSFNGTTYEKL